MQIWAQVYFDLVESRTEYQQASMARCLQSIYNMESFLFVCKEEHVSSFELLMLNIFLILLETYRDNMLLI